MCIFPLLFVHFTYQFLIAVANAMVGPRAWIGGIFNRSSNKRLASDKYLNYPLTPHQVNQRAILAFEVILPLFRVPSG